MRPILLTICIGLIAQLALGQHEGVATYFDGLGTPYGGCGVPQEYVDSPHFVALNVYDTPGDYSFYDRPLKGNDLTKMGEFANGLNCGRWIKVTMWDDCDGMNGGEQGEEFCTGGSGWYADEYNGAVQYMVVADACGDDNGWCRDSRYHLDLVTASVNTFEKDGQVMDDLIPTNWNNRIVKWEYINAPDYEGDIDIYFMKDAQQYWPAIMINHLENGIHKVEQKVGESWVEAERNSDLGQAFILPDFAQPYEIRVYDFDDQLINGGQSYLFSNPCNGSCGPAVTLVDYDIIDCNGDYNGTSKVDACGSCAGGNTGIPFVPQASECVVTGLTTAAMNRSAVVTGYVNLLGQMFLTNSSNLPGGIYFELTGLSSRKVLVID